MQERLQVDLNNTEPQTHEGLAIVGLTGGCVQLAEKGFSDLTGYDPDEVAGVSLKVLFPKVGEILDPVEEGLRGWKGELDLNRKDDTNLTVYVSIVPARDEDMRDVAFMMRLNRVDY